MNELVATYKFVDIDRDEVTLMSDVNLTHNEWLTKVNEHNISILNKRCIGYDFTEKEVEAMRKNV